MGSFVTETPAATPAESLKRFQSIFAFETDCWDVHDALQRGEADFVLLDVRSAEAYARGHIPGSVLLPHRKIVEAKLSAWPKETLFVVYCAGPHCNGAYRGAVRLARLGRSVKVMLGGVTGWADEGFDLIEEPSV
ncbi:MAG: rhodanese-like domain-containing protein [Burkholderiaceae bacterium]